MKKYFDILELDESATIEAVEKAYQELTHAWRPENYQNLPRYRRKAEAKLKEINEAYERLKSHLANRPSPEPMPRRTEAKPQSADAGLGPQPPADRSLESEPAPTPQRSSDPPPWEPEYPTQPDNVISRPQIQRTVQKSLIFGFVAIIAVLGVLLLYRVLDRQQLTEPRSAVIEKAQPTAAAARKPAAAVSPEKAPAHRAQTATGAAQPKDTARAGVQKQASPSLSAIPDQIDYQKALSEAVLSPYNRNMARVRRVQKSLIASGYEPGPIDGIIGPLTSSALQQFAADHQIGHDHLFAPDLAAAAVLYAEVAAAHPNWHQIVASDEFVSWLDSQSDFGKDQIRALKDSATARQVNDMIELYKLEHNMQPD